LRPLPLSSHLEPSVDAGDDVDGRIGPTEEEAEADDEEDDEEKEKEAGLEEEGCLMGPDSRAIKSKERFMLRRTPPPPGAAADPDIAVAACALRVFPLPASLWVTALPR